MQIAFGYTPAWVVAIKSDGAFTQSNKESSPGHLKTEGELVGWTRAIVSLTHRETRKRRLFFLAPGHEESAMGLEGFMLSGMFEVVSKERNPKRASEAWEIEMLEELR